MVGLKTTRVSSSIYPDRGTHPGPTDLSSEPQVRFPVLRTVTVCANRGPPHRTQAVGGRSSPSTPPPPARLRTGETRWVRAVERWGTGKRSRSGRGSPNTPGRPRSGPSLLVDRPRPPVGLVEVVCLDLHRLLFRPLLQALHHRRLVVRPVRVRLPGLVVVVCVPVAVVVHRLLLEPVVPPRRPHGPALPHLQVPLHQVLRPRAEHARRGELLEDVRPVAVLQVLVPTTPLCLRGPGSPGGRSGSGTGGCKGGAEGKDEE